MASNSKNLVPTVFKHYTTHDQARDTGTLNGPHGESTEETMQGRLSCTVKNQSQKTCWSAWGCRPLFQNGGHFLITMPSPGRPNHLQVTELTLFHNSVPLTVGHAVPRSSPPIISPWFTWNNPHTENPLAFSLFQQHTVYTHYYNNYSIDYWNCLFAGIVLLKPGAMVPHPHIPSITYSAWHFRNTENNVCLCFNKGCTYSSETKWLTILTKEYYLGVS